MTSKRRESAQAVVKGLLVTLDGSAQREMTDRRAEFRREEDFAARVAIERTTHGELAAFRGIVRSRVDVVDPARNFRRPAVPRDDRRRTRRDRSKTIRGPLRRFPPPPWWPPARGCSGAKRPPERNSSRVGSASRTARLPGRVTHCEYWPGWASISREAYPPKGPAERAK